MKLETLKPLQEKVGSSIQETATDEEFLNRSLVADKIRLIDDKSDLMKLQDFFLYSKESVKGRHSLQGGRYTFASYISDQLLLSRIDKEFQN